VIRALENLLELQNIDMRLSDVRARLASFPKKFAALDAQVASARSELERSKTAHVGALKDRKKYELDVEQWKERVRKYKDQSSQVKTNEAFKALQHEVQMAEEEIAKAEDRLLEQMVNGEEYDRQIKASEKLLKEAEERVRGERAALETEKAAIEKEFEQLNAGRARVVVEIPEDMLDHYERIAKKHHGVSLAEVRGETCGACGVRIRPHVFQEMRRATGEEIFHCETCTRILYYVEPQPSAASAPASDSTNHAAAPSSREN
jgi:predicted  nucleic acid-binding Zn-ribbon protein